MLKRVKLKIDHRPRWPWLCRPLGLRVWILPGDNLQGSAQPSNKLNAFPLYVKTGVGMSEKKLPSSTQGILKIGQVKCLSLLMKSLCTEPHTCTVSITTVKQDWKSRQCWSRQPTLRWSRCISVMLLLQDWYVAALSAWTHLYDDYFRKFLLIYQKKMLFLFMHLYIYAWRVFYVHFQLKSLCASVRHTLDVNYFLCLDHVPLLLRLYIRWTVFPHMSCAFLCQVLMLQDFFHFCSFHLRLSGGKDESSFPEAHVYWRHWAMSLTGGPELMSVWSFETARHV